MEVDGRAHIVLSLVVEGGDKGNAPRGVHTTARVTATPWCECGTVLRYADGLWWCSACGVSLNRSAMRGVARKFIENGDVGTVYRRMAGMK